MLTKVINLSLKNDCFLDDLKLVQYDLDKESDRPVSVLPHISKVFERIMYTQIESFVEDTLSKFLTGCRKNHRNPALFEK